MEKAKLQCRVAQGFLKYEASVFVDGLLRRYETWAPATLIEPRGELSQDLQSGFVSVKVVRRDDARGAILVELPVEVVMGGRRIWVAEDKVGA